MGEMGAGHFLYIPGTIVLGIVIGWILGSRAARDAFAAELIVPNRMAPRFAGSPWQNWLAVYRFPRELLLTGHEPAERPLPEGWRASG